ncbi:transmembrane protein, putative (macronuclear) [Tetrahymena thermophila SB210]|uniref:Transmembrane protein, putative n=1 Tax=Tetrahymena thermophila (strain SB210) TaxID=312017 RepID=I7MAQ7_TETTS|nr:transmembrane protein, putative [Tetrahymena thermophila SB210]EAS05113.3 transmembrane protein, putative [Tetrahymena thermophila SB210]|eukprot:XP_001025358.3 transmembrane protein, putative [Tetrahymena thermophila SB210]
MRCFQITQLIISSSPQVVKYIQIQSNLNKYNQNNINTLVEIEFRPCQIGEVILQQSSSIQICQFCSDGTYSLMDPSQEICKKCPDSAKKCIGNQIDLYNGYWRNNNQTDEIVQCDSIIGSCIAENYQNGNKICKQGYLGPLCEECDMDYAQDSNNQSVRYVTSIYSKQCNQCSISYLQYIFLLLQICAVLAYLIYNSLKFIDNSLVIQTQQYLRNMKILPISKPPSSSYLHFFPLKQIQYLKFQDLQARQLLSAQCVQFL